MVMCLDPSDEKYYEVDLMAPIQSLSSKKLRVNYFFNFLQKKINCMAF